MNAFSLYQIFNLVVARVMMMKAVMMMAINSVMMMFVESMYSNKHTYPSDGSRATFHSVTTKDNDQSFQS